MKLILASRSPRRRELLTDAGYRFTVMPPSEIAECGICSGEAPPEFVARLAHQKARDVALRIEEGVVLGCDTVAECHGHILGKPRDREHAGEMLRLMRGRIHHVHSGVCLWQRPGDTTQVDVAVTRLRMDGISDRQLSDYLDTDQWCDKAGAFGFQDGLDWVHIEAGSASNVVGLPMELLEKMLENIKGYP